MRGSLWTAVMSCLALGFCCLATGASEPPIDQWVTYAQPDDGRVAVPSMVNVSGIASQFVEVPSREGSKAYLQQLFKGTMHDSHGVLIVNFSRSWRVDETGNLFVWPENTTELQAVAMATKVPERRERRVTREPETFQLGVNQGHRLTFHYPDNNMSVDMYLLTRGPSLYNAIVSYPTQHATERAPLVEQMITRWRLGDGVVETGEMKLPEIPVGQRSGTSDSASQTPRPQLAVAPNIEASRSAQAEYERIASIVFPCVVVLGLGLVVRYILVRRPLSVAAALVLMAALLGAGSIPLFRSGRAEGVTIAVLIVLAPAGFGLLRLGARRPSK